jgi:hypothetical protein
MPVPLRPWTNAAIAVGLFLLVSLLDAATSTGTQSNARRIAERQSEIAAMGARAVLLGNSILDRGVDAEEFSRLTGVPTFKFASNGSASAYWFVIFKNVLATLPERPETVVVLFRDTLLTQPDFDVEGKYREDILRWTVGPEAELQNLALNAGGGWMDRAVLARYPLLQRRYKFSDRVSTLLKQGVALACRARKGAAADAVDRVFATANMNAQLLTARQQAEVAGKTKQEFDFARDVQHSFLPSMIAIARERGIRLGFVRTRRRVDALGEARSGAAGQLEKSPAGLRDDETPVPMRDEAALDRYIGDLKAYLAKNDCPFFDFTKEERLTLDMFADGDHLQADTGRPLFTKILAEALRPLIAAP